MCVCVNAVRYGSFLPNRLFQCALYLLANSPTVSYVKWNQCLWFLSRTKRRRILCVCKSIENATLSSWEKRVILRRVKQSNPKKQLTFTINAIVCLLLVSVTVSSNLQNTRIAHASITELLFCYGETKAHAIVLNLLSFSFESMCRPLMSIESSLLPCLLTWK